MTVLDHGVFSPKLLSIFWPDFGILTDSRTDHWYEIEVSVCCITTFDGLQHDVHGQGAVVSWVVK